MSTTKADCRKEPDEPFNPLIVHERGEIVSALVARRYALGWTGEDLDERAGWADRYTGKIEKPNRPQGRPSFRFDWPCEVTPGGAVHATAMGQVWLESVGLRLVLVDSATAASIGAVPAPPVWPHQQRPERNVVGPHLNRRLSKGRHSAMSIEAYAVSERAEVASVSIRATITDHPFLETRPSLKAAAEEIEAALADLAARIKEAA